MAKINVTLKGVVCSGIKDLGTGSSRFNLLMISKIQHDHSNTEEMLPTPKLVPIDILNSDNLYSSISAGKAIKVNIAGDSDNFQIGIVSPVNYPGCMLENFLAQD